MIKVASQAELDNYLAYYRATLGFHTFDCTLDSLFLKTLHGILDVSLDLKLNELSQSVKNKNSEQYRSDFVHFQTHVERNQTPLPGELLITETQSSMLEWIKIHPVTQQMGLDFSQPIHLVLQVENSTHIPLYLIAQWQALATKSFEMAYSTAMLYYDEKEASLFQICHANLLLAFLSKVYKKV